MVKKSLISLGVVLAVCASTACAMANSTVYTDDLGRMHFLGKDPGAKTLQPVSNFDNSSEMVIQNGEIIKRPSAEVINTPPNAGYERRYKYRETNVNSVQQSKATGSFTYEKGAMDASNPYTYGETNIKSLERNTQETTNTETKKKHFWNK